jgi:hypothetical protein
MPRRFTQSGELTARTLAEHAEVPLGYNQPAEETEHTVT